MFVGNAIVGQSGGPTSAINATLSGVIRGVALSKKINKLYGMKNGIEGFLQNKIIDLSYLFNDESSLELLESTPSCILGSCRKRLPNVSDDKNTYERMFDVFKKYNIRHFFYIGGNDSMDTVLKISKYAEKSDYKINVIGIPKTIDNDLIITDHTPGYGSASKYIATVIQEIAADISAYLCKSVTVVEIMGRDSGWLTASSGLPKYFGNQGADLIYLPEKYFDGEDFVNAVKKLLFEKNNLLVCVSEGLRYSDGRYVSEKNQSKITDTFGHKYLSGNAKVLEELIKEKIGCKTRSIELNLPQRCASHLSSSVDISESIELGKYAVECAQKCLSGKMVIYERTDSENYNIRLSYENVEKIANKVKYVPPHFITPEGNGVTEECMKYIAPLIQGERNLKYKNGLPIHFKIN